MLFTTKNIRALLLNMLKYFFFQIYKCNKLTVENIRGNHPPRDNHVYHSLALSHAQHICRHDYV